MGVKQTGDRAKMNGKSRPKVKPKTAGCGRFTVRRLLMIIGAAIWVMMMKKWVNTAEINVGDVGSSLTISVLPVLPAAPTFDAARKLEVRRTLTLVRTMNAERRLLGKTLAQMAPVGQTTHRSAMDLSVYERFIASIGQSELYSESASHSVLRSLLKSLATSDIRRVAVIEKGTQLKFTAELNDGLLAIIKPERPSRSYEASPDVFYFNDLERHYAEVAAFHIDRALGFRRVPPCVLRVISIKNDIQARSDDENLLKTFFTSPAGNTCFYGYCKYYCDSSHAFCGRPRDTLEVAVCLWLPYARFGRDLYEHPWRRSYSKRRTASWQSDSVSASYCSQVRMRSEMNGRALLDLIDLSVLDFLMANQDRHHYCRFSVFRNLDASINHIDNGRAFSSFSRDDLSILAPLTQCCQIRKSTYDKLVLLNPDPEPSPKSESESEIESERAGNSTVRATRRKTKRATPVRLSELVRLSFEDDELHRDRPILLDSHLQALDRRAALVLRLVRNCITAFGTGQVLVDDRY